MTNERPFANARYLGRPRIRDGSTEAEIAIFRVAEQMLEDQTLADLSVSKMIEEAGISRATFYHYFSSKLGVIAGLLARTMDEIFEVASPFLKHEGADTVEDSLRISIESSVRVWSEHRLLLRTVMENWPSDAELEAQWLDAMSRFTGAVAEEIDVAREAGDIPPGLPSRELAAVLCWSTERCLYIAGRNVESALAGEQEAARGLLEVWTRTLGVRT